MSDDTDYSIDSFDTAQKLRALEGAIEEIVARNKRVELHKAWEQSWTRLHSITAITYITMVLMFIVLGSARPILDALVPTTGFFLSTLSLPMVRRMWEKRIG